MEYDQHVLPLDCWISIFSFLNEDDLIRASCVCKEWYEAGETPWLWRALCLRRWSFCNLGQLLSASEKYTWKRYYLHRSKLELHMKSGRPGGDYTCKSLRGHKGKVVGFSYLVGNTSLQDTWNCCPVVCSASADGTVKAWDIHKGVSLWSSSAGNPLTAVATDPQRRVVVTSDITGVIKAWQGHSGAELASFCSASPQCTLLTFCKAGNSFLMVGTAAGSLLVLSSPLLSEISRHEVCDSFRVNVILPSPDEKWIFAASKENFDLGPKVFWSDSLCSPVAGDDAACTRLPVTGFAAAVFLPAQPARVAVIHSGGPLHRTALSVFDLAVKKSKFKTDAEAQQVESFPLDLNQRDSDVIVQAKGSSTILVTNGTDLNIYTLKGALVASFKDHIQPIISLCADSFRVVTASRDLSLRVLTWRKDQDTGLPLESQYHLLGGSHTAFRGLTGVACDYASIVASAESVEGKDVLKAYIFNS